MSGKLVRLFRRCLFRGGSVCRGKGVGGAGLGAFSRGGGAGVAEASWQSGENVSAVFPAVAENRRCCPLPIMRSSNCSRSMCRRAILQGNFRRKSCRKLVFCFFLKNMELYEPGMARILQSMGQTLK